MTKWSAARRRSIGYALCGLVGGYLGAFAVAALPIVLLPGWSIYAIAWVESALCLLLTALLIAVGRRNRGRPRAFLYYFAPIPAMLFVAAYLIFIAYRRIFPAG